MKIQPGEITAKLQLWNEGDPEALDQLMPLVLEELRRCAYFYFNREDADHTLQPTALISEVCLRLMSLRKVQWENRRQFFAFAGKLMRRVLIDAAKVRKAAKRGRHVEIVSLTGGMDREAAASVPPAILLSLHEALEQLEALDPLAAQIVELRFFAGLTGEETATALGISRTTVTREWAMAKEFLARELGAPVPAVS
ncbi:MAG: sigma-70 family RNA polymerase sigma factor [Acidobacteria bacterium]|nr:sigma-70 family RNA polymerase sigma factor [Acidobacteriota bacterium]